MESIMEIYGLKNQYDHLQSTMPNPAPADNLVRAMILDPARTTDNRTQLKRLGYNDKQIDNIILSYYRTTGEDTLRTAYLRGTITREKLYERMHELGYTDTRIAEIVPTWEMLPGPQDLFTMVAHEAFEPDMYKMMGLEAEFPTEQVNWLKKQGISEAWARKYWIAHWQQPSLEMGFEMLHRGIIDLKTLDMLFRTVEIPQYWRDKITRIAYTPYTRVDARRMHALGVLSDEELIRSFMDIGYDVAHAVKMAEFTIRDNANAEHQLTRSTILSSYEKKLISRTDAKELLVSQNLSGAAAEYYLTLSDYNQQLALQDLLLENLHDRYILRDITERQARDALGATGMLGDRINALIEAWNLEAYKHTKTPSLSDLSDFLLRGIISEAQYRDSMSRLGYKAVSINWYVKALRSPEAATPRLPSRTDLETWWKKGIIDEATWRSEMHLLRYDDRYINYYWAELSPPAKK